MSATQAESTHAPPHPSCRAMIGLAPFHPHFALGRRGALTLSTSATADSGSLFIHVVLIMPQRDFIIWLEGGMFIAVDFETAGP